MYIYNGTHTHIYIYIYIHPICTSRWCVRNYFSWDRSKKVLFLFEIPPLALHTISSRYTLGNQRKPRKLKETKQDWKKYYKKLNDLKN